MKTTTCATACATGCLAVALALLGGIALNAADPFTFDTARAAAAKGDANAQYFLAECYANGAGTAQDYAKAAQSYRQAAESGHVMAQYRLGGLYHNGHGVKQDDGEAVTWYAKAAEYGDRRAQYCMGRACYYGLGVAKDMKQTVKWYTMAAEQGQPEAMEELGVIYLLGDEGVERDYAVSAKWLRKAAGLGRPAAFNNLGELCEANAAGDLTPTNAAAFYRQAAEKGLAHGAFNLGRLYLDGAGGVQRDKVEAYAWLTLALKNGDNMAHRFLREMDSHGLLSREDLQKAERRMQEIAKAVPALSPGKRRTSTSSQGKAAVGPPGRN